jgi:hypothetical protein
MSSSIEKSLAEKKNTFSMEVIQVTETTNSWTRSHLIITHRKKVIKTIKKCDNRLRVTIPLVPRFPMYGTAALRPQHYPKVTASSCVLIPKQQSLLVYTLKRNTHLCFCEWSGPAESLNHADDHAAGAAERKNGQGVQRAI